LLFEDLFNDFLEYAEKRHKKQGFITLQTDFKNHVLPYFIGKDIISITKKDIVDWENDILSHNFSNKYNSKIYYSFNYFMKYCYNLGYVNSNFVSEVGSFPKKVEYKSHTVYTLSQFLRFRYYINNVIIKQYFNFMYFYGTRPSETMALRFCDIKGRYVYIRHSLHRKGNRDLDTPKNQSSIRILKVKFPMLVSFYLLKRFYIRKFGLFSVDYFVFGGKKPLAPTTIDRIKENACKRAKTPYITQHEFRHSYATRKIHRKVPIDKVSRSLGHSKVSTTLDYYLHQEKNTCSVFFD